MRIEPPTTGVVPKILVFRMNEVCAAGTGAFLDEQSDRLGIPVETFGEIALKSTRPVPIAGRCAVFAKTDMIHQAQEGTPIPDILMGLASALVRNYRATLVRGEPLVSIVSLQGGVMHNAAVVEAFRRVLDLPEDRMIIPPNFGVVGAFGCAILAARQELNSPVTLATLKEAAGFMVRNFRPATSLKPLPRLPRGCKPESGREENLAAPFRHPGLKSRPCQETERSTECSTPDSRGGNDTPDTACVGGRALDRSKEIGISDNAANQGEGDRSTSSLSVDRPLVMGLDVGSVSVKGVLVDAGGTIVEEDYRLSRSRPLDTLAEVIRSLTGSGLMPDAVAVTGSGRYLAGRLLNADVVVNEIIAQAEAALSFDPNVETIVEIGGQDSKWISLRDGGVHDFEMNRVCAAGTGSFLMAQAGRLGLDMGKEFSDAAFSSQSPVDLGTRCTVFMESDLIHHQNNGASVEDLAAGVCLSVVENYLERMANNKEFGEKAMFLGGVAASPAVAAALEHETGRHFRVPEFYKVSGALGAALNCLSALAGGEVHPQSRTSIEFTASEIDRSEFACRGCTNQCAIRKYKFQGEEHLQRRPVRSLGDRRVGRLRSS